jgi:hypothetical protein
MSCLFGFRKTSNIQVLDGHRFGFADDAVRQLVDEILSPVGNLAMNAGNAQPCLSRPWLPCMRRDKDFCARRRRRWSARECLGFVSRLPSL